MTSIYCSKLNSDLSLMETGYGLAIGRLTDVQLDGIMAVGDVVHKTI
ncbi:hypothetical protein Plhal304r1_c010g0039311 [Plasmopara halstedii]